MERLEELKAKELARQDRANRFESYRQRQLFLEELNAKEFNRLRPESIIDWRFNLANKTSLIGDFRRFIDHTEVFKIKSGTKPSGEDARGYIHVTSPYWPAVRNLDEELFMTSLGYIKSEHRIYNPDAVTYYKIINCLTSLRREMKALGYRSRH